MKTIESNILKARVLIVDDQPVNVELLEQLLSQAGYSNVTSTTQPTEVCALHAAEPFDLILLDLKMPGMDGFEVMEALKAHIKSPTMAEELYEVQTGLYLPVIVLTAEPGYKLRALNAGARDFISKPFDVVEVKTRIHHMLEVRLLYKKVAEQNQLLQATLKERTALLLLVESQAMAEQTTTPASTTKPLPKLPKLSKLPNLGNGHKPV